MLGLLPAVEVPLPLRAVFLGLTASRLRDYARAVSSLIWPLIAGVEVVVQSYFYNGHFRCSCCGNPVFPSFAKYQAGSGGDFP